MLINFFGKRGAGKTTAIKGQLKDCRGPVVIIDVLGNFQPGEKDQPGWNSENWIQLDKIQDAILWCAEYIKNPVEENKVIVLRGADPDIMVDYMSVCLWESARGTLVLDETDAFSLANAPCFDQLVRYGRNRNIDLITGVRRPAEISRNITAGANQLFAFQTQEPRDIDYFRSTVFGERAEELISMEKYHGLFIDYDKSLIGKFRIDESGRIFKLSGADVNKVSQSTKVVDGKQKPEAGLKPMKEEKSEIQKPDSLGKVQP